MTPPVRDVAVKVGVRTAVPGDVRVAAESGVRWFRVTQLDEQLIDGEYSVAIGGPILLKSGQDHARQNGWRSYRAVEELPELLRPLALGPQGLCALLRQAGAEWA